jgi:hypothetical protein
MMSNYDINSNPALVKLMIENAKKATKKYLEEHPGSLIPLFEKELRELGFEFEISNQILCFMPKHKETILPIAIRYYKAAKYDNEQAYFIGFFRFKGFEEVVPMLLEDFYNPDTPKLTRERIGDALWEIRSKKYIDEYLKILSTPEYENDYLFIAHLVSGLKVEAAIPIFIKMLDNENICALGVIALGKYKREEFRPYFERFENDKNSFLKKSAKAALKKLG